MLARVGPRRSRQPVERLVAHRRDAQVAARVEQRVPHRLELPALEQQEEVIVLIVHDDRWGVHQPRGDYPVQRQRVLDVVVQAKSSLESLKATQAQTAVARAAGLQNARTLVEQAEKKLADIKSDAAQFQIKSPSDGVVAYGAMVDGVLTGGDPKAYEVGDKLAAGQVLMRIYQPGKLRLVINVPESQAFWIEKGDKARITPASLPQTSYTAETSPIELQTKAQGMGFVTTLDLANADSRLMPGMKATVVIDAGKVKDALLLPLSSVVGGKVKVKQENDKIVEKAVKVGKTDGKMVQILSGLGEGDEVQK